jgi:hypothetical protein
MGVGISTAGAATPSDPATGYPSFNNGVVNQIRGSGSDTTFFMMQKISDLYTSAGLYGCTLNSLAGQTLFNSSFTSTGSNLNYYCQSGANISTTDNADNWSRTEVAQGVDAVGSGAGAKQLCGASTSPSPLNVDFSRASSPQSPCTGLLNIGYAKDAVPAVTWTFSPASVATAATSAPYASVNGGLLGPVASGWLPGDSPTGTSFSGTAFTNISNNDNGGGASSTAYRLWCAKPTSSPAEITDWGQLTNLGPNLAVPNVQLTSGGTGTSVPNATSLPSGITGDSVVDLTTAANIPSGTTVSGIDGSGNIILSNPAAATSKDNLRIVLGSALPADSGFPIGLAINIVGVNPSSGTQSTWASFANSGVGGGLCASNANGNAAAGGRTVLENNASQIGDNAQSDFPTDLGAQADEITTSIYYQSLGVYNSVPYSGAVCFPDVTNASGCATSSGSALYSSVTLNLNNKAPSKNNITNNIFPTARTLFNVINTAALRASAAGFINWICDSQSAITKQRDNSTGINFDNELTSTIQGFGFARLTDTSTAAPTNTPPDNVTNGGINTSCAAGIVSGKGNGQPAVVAADVTSANG